MIADKIYYLNKILHSVDIYHEVELPSTFFLEHPVGTVLGRAKYQDGLWHIRTVLSEEIKAFIRH